MCAQEVTRNSSVILDMKRGLVQNIANGVTEVAELPGEWPRMDQGAALQAVATTP